MVRGLAVIMMVLSNFLFDLYSFYGFSALEGGFSRYFARATAGLFILIAGVSLRLHFDRTGGAGKSFRPYYRRVLKLFGLGLMISAATWFAVGDQLVVFGILHFLGASSLLAYPFLKLRYLNLIGGIAVICLGFWLNRTQVDFVWLVWLGLMPATFRSVDYIPVFPWFGVILLGIYVSCVVFPEGRQRYEIKRDPASSVWGRFFILLGRNSLLIYFVHQPLLLGGLYLFKKLS